MPDIKQLSIYHSPWNISKENICQGLIHISYILNQLKFYKWMNIRENVVYIHHRTLVKHKEECYSALARKWLEQKDIMLS